MARNSDLVSQLMSVEIVDPSELRSAVRVFTNIRNVQRIACVVFQQ